MSAPTPVPMAVRRRRVVFCRRCGVDTLLPGCAYCDTCRPERTTDALMAPADWERIAELADTHVYVPLLAPRHRGKVPANPHAGTCSCGAWSSPWLSNPNYPREAHNGHRAEHGLLPR